MAGLTKLAAYVGVPAATSKERSDQLLKMAGKTKNKKKQERLKKAATGDINNAELLFVFSKGSPKRKQPPRPVLEPAIEAQGNKEAISNELAQSVKASIAGDGDTATKRMRRAALAAQNAARGWFTDPRNSWAPLAESTKRARAGRMTKAQRAAATGKNGELLNEAFTPGVDTGAMRASIQGIIAEE